MRAHTVVVLLAALAACEYRADYETIDNTREQLEGVTEAQEQRIDELTTTNAELARHVKELEASLAKSKTTEEVIESAKDEISSHAQEILARFRGDSEISVETTSDGYRFVLREKVLFGTGSADLTEEGRVALARVSDALRGGKHRVSIEGHTDDVPVAKEETKKKFPRGNMDLSVQRSLSVWDFLVHDAKIKETRVSVAGFGPHRPRVPNDSERNRWRNRRVEIRVDERDAD